MWRGSRRNKQIKTARSALARGKTQERRKRRVLLIAGGVFATTLLFFSAVSTVSFLDAVAIKDVQVAGNTTVSTKAIDTIAYAQSANALKGVISQNNIILYPQERVRTALLVEFPKLDTVSVTRSFGEQKVVIDVTEREVFGVWCSEDRVDCFAFDPNGFIFERVATTTQAVVFTGGIATDEPPLTQYVSVDYFQKVKQLLEQFIASNISIVRVAFVDDDARFFTTEGWYVFVALDKDIDTLQANLDVVLDVHGLRARTNELRYIDMRFDERVYYKLKEDTVGDVEVPEE